MLGACATTEYVDKGDAALQAKIDALSAQVAPLPGQIQANAAAAAAAQSRADAAYTLAQGKFNYEVVSTDSSTLFDTGKSDLSQDDKDRLLANGARWERELARNIAMDAQYR